jgi:hypothetical protein
MIARRWHGGFPPPRLRILKLIEDVGLPIIAQPRQSRRLVPAPREGDIVHVEMFTLWEDSRPIRRFAGDS